MIYIIGAGAVGKSLAVSLKLHQRDVTIIRGSVDQADRYVERIEIWYNNQEALVQEVEVSTLNHHSELEGVVVLTNKSYGNDELARKLEGKTSSSPVVLLQNGLGIEGPFWERLFPEIYRGILFLSGEKTVKGVNYTPVADSPIGVVRSNNTQLDALVELLNTPYFEFRTEEFIEKIIWEKAIANTVFNSICPLLDIDNGIFHRDPQVFGLARKIIAQCIMVAHAEGISINQEDMEARVLHISKKSDGSLISTLQDMRNGRETEIDTLNGAIVEVAQKYNQEHVVEETKLLGELIRMKSQLMRKHNNQPS
ncbi:MAG: 2-dehydropantoate 2-reductase [Cyclobacteriaceae bacterium]|nr:2-dehydropantoate 2-reductase [Cyclobacteriaceae bacterium]